MISFIFAPKSTENFGSVSADAGRKRMIMDEKKALRKEIRQLKQTCLPEEKLRKSASVWEKVEGMPIFREAKTVLAYWSMDDEVYTHDFVKKWAGRKTFLLPCVRGDELELRYFDGEEKLAPGEGYAIPEPVGELFMDWAQIDLILVPGVAFDRAGNRLGRGRGYYDKVLKQTRAHKAGIAFDFQMVEQVPVEPHDVRMDSVVFSDR